MFAEDAYNDAHAQYGIDEAYVHAGIDFNLLQKLYQRAEYTLDASEKVVQKNVDSDMILIFYKKVPGRNLIYRFLEGLHKSPEKLRDFKRYYTLLNEEELYEAIKLQKFVLVTPKDVASSLSGP